MTNPDFNHLMIDLETMDTRPTASILSIGAVVFNPVKGTLGNRLHRTVLLDSCLDLGLTVSGDTIMWWLRQSDEARAAIAKGNMTLQFVLQDLAFFIAQNPVHRVWSHGTVFDIAVLEHAFRAAKHKLPWAYNDSRDTRTIFEAAEVNLNDFREGTAHNALDDAVSQAKAVNAAYRQLGLSQ